MLRRRHKKSRAGCLECKRRHVKCDERRPVCSLCSVSERTCTFPTIAPFEYEQLPVDSSDNTSRGTSPLGTSAAFRGPAPVIAPALPVFPSQSTGSPSATGDGTDPLLLIDDADGAINVSHAELIVHLMSNQDIQSLAANREDLTSGMILGLRAGIRTPYLLYVLLAFSARHLSYLAANGSDSKSSSGSKSQSQSQSHHLLEQQQQQQQQEETPEQSSKASLPSSVPWMPSSSSLPSHSSSLSSASSSSPSSFSSPSLSTAPSPGPPPQPPTQPTSPPSQYQLPSSLPPLSFSSTPPYLTQSAAAAARYKRQAVLLQTRAISLFNTAWRAVHGVIDRSNCVPMLLFSSILGHHLFADSLSRREDTIDKFLEHYVQCAQLQQGVYAIATTTWPFLVVSEFAPILQWSARFTSREGRGSDCARLLTLINGASDDRLSSAEKGACRNAIRLLQVGFDVLYLPPPKTPKTPKTPATSSSRNGSADADADADAMDMDGPAAEPEEEEEEEEESEDDKAEHSYRHKMILLWALIMPKEFADLLAAKNPESLVVLAYYACLLNHGRHLWQVGDAGEYIMGLINAHLGPAWDEWLDEPRHRMATDVVEARTP